MLPDFLIIGAQKAGTTSLAKNLARHPDIHMPADEIHYFDKDFNFRKGVEWYENHFTGAKQGQAIGEKTPDYLWANGNGVEGHLPFVHKNIYNTLPEARLIVILRNPVERAISAVNHIIRSGRISPLHNIDDLLTGKKKHLVEGHGVIDKGRYYNQLKAYCEYFDLKQILVLFFEDEVEQNPALGLRHVCDFLNINPDIEFADKYSKFNEFGSSRLGLVIKYYLPFMKLLSKVLNLFFPSPKARPNQETVSKLYEIYRDQNEKLFDLLQRKPASWTMDK